MFILQRKLFFAVLMNNLQFIHFPIELKVKFRWNSASGDFEVNIGECS